MKLVYICSLYAGEVERYIRFAQEACRYAISQNCAPVAVHLLYPQLLDDMVPKERKIGIQMGLRILINCEELWLCGSPISAGMLYELKEGERLGITIRGVSEEEIMEHSKIRKELCQRKGHLPEYDIDQAVNSRQPI